jgi:hypothetical protein
LLTGRLASSSVAPGSFTFSIPGNTVSPITFPAITGGRYDQKAFLQTFSASVNPVIKDQSWSWNLAYANTTGSGYIDFIDLEYPRKLNALNENPHYYLPNKTDSTFTISILNKQVNHQIWLKTKGNSWRKSTNLLLNKVPPGSELLIFDPTKAADPLTLTLLGNQNIAADESADLLVISSPTILPVATLFARYRSSKGIKAKAYSTQEIYNEFSAGKVDVTAIRDFIRLKKPRFVLLMGDASVDYKGINKVVSKRKNSEIPSIPKVTFKFIAGIHKILVTN